MTHEAFTQALLAMQTTLYRISASLLRQSCDQEDAVQSALEKALRRRSSLRDESKLRGWMARILINECYAVLRAHKRETLVDTPPETPAPAGCDPDLYRFFSGLTEALRLPMVLHYVEGYPLEEVARALRLPIGTVKSRLARGRDKMREDEAFKEVQNL